MPVTEYTKENKKYLIYLTVSILITWLLFLYLRLLALHEGVDFGVDVYYHIKAADLFPFISQSKQFPWTEMSIWKMGFYDKELGFHAILYFLRAVGSHLGVSFNAPFHFIDMALFTIIIIVASFGSYIYCKATSFMVPPLLVFTCPIFLEKLNTIRPFLVSIILFFLVMFFLISKTKLIIKVILIFSCAWLYALCYSVPHIIILPVLAYIVACIFFEKSKKSCYSILLLFSAVLGIAAGLYFHPQFPNTFTGWYIQGVEVIKQMLGLSKYEVGLGVGLLAPSIKQIFMNSFVIVLFLINWIFIVKTKNKSKELFFLFILQLVVIIGFFFSKRFIEYAVPVCVFSFAYTVGNYKNFVPNSIFFKFIYNIKLVITIIILIIMVPFGKIYLGNIYKMAPLYSFGKWASKNIEPGTYIGLLHWGDFPRAFYVADRYSYSMALDPMFSYYIYPERTKKIEMFRTGKQLISPAELYEALGTEYLYASKPDHRAVMYLIDNGAKVLYYDKQGCLLKLPILQESILRLH
ncbi:MAG: hypothetical protein GY756_00210 [bacterium]|nr:hypothetical protein [bacterium]